jgi:hypothetical protein
MFEGNAELYRFVEFSRVGPYPPLCKEKAMAKKTYYSIILGCSTKIKAKSGRKS